ncbi:MAG: extracellular solute-binding protein [Rhizobacter sp.]|nr:extracellular solute-binding protein [Chlorobiales bacterium]
MKTTRFIFFRRTAFALLLAASTLTGCRGDRDKIITIWTQMVPGERKILDEMLVRFAQTHPEYKDYQFKELFYETEQVRQNFMIAALGGSGSELVYGPSDNVGPFTKLEVIQPLEKLFDQAYFDKFIAAPVKANTDLNGHTYQIADQVGNHLCLVYNKDLIPEPPRTMSELIRFGKTFTKDTNGDGRIDQYALAWNYIEPFFFVPFLGGYGGNVMDSAFRPTLNDEATVKASQLIKDLRDVYKIIPRESDYDIANTLFKEGRAAMIINGPWSWAGYRENGINFGIARIPMIDETGLYPAPMVSPRGYSINVNTQGEKLKVTVELLKFLTSPETELEFTRKSATIPSRVEAYNFLTALLEDSLAVPEGVAVSDELRKDLLSNKAVLRGSIEQMKVGRTMPVVSEMRVIWDSMRPAYQAVLGGGKTPAAAASEMQALAEKLIDEMKQ